MAQTILVADDEPAVRSFVLNILRREGFELVEAVDGTDAMERAHGAGAIDLLVTDVRMPRMDGISLAARLREERPGTPVIYISGYPLELESGDRLPGACASLRKPFTRGALLEAVGTCLGGAARAGGRS